MLIQANYLQHLGGEDDELKAIQDNLKKLEQKETLYAIMDNLKVSFSMNDTLETMILDRKDKDVLAWLQSTDVSINHRLARRKHEATTGNWFLESEDFLNWAKATKASLWLHGIPGAGKTILCSTIIERVIEICNSNISDQFAYFYFDFNARWTVIDMLRSVIAQLCTRKIPPKLRDLYQQCDKGQRQPDQISLLTIFSSLLTDSHRTFIILDALDECATGRDREDLLDVIKEMMDLSSKYLNILVTSRREKDIEDKLKVLIDNTVPLEERVVDSDIVLHVRECLKNDDRLRDWDDDTQKNIEEMLCKGAHGMYLMSQRVLLIVIRFRWVECQLKTLRDCRDIEDVEIALTRLPKDLDSTYDRILNNIVVEKDRARARSILRLIAVAYRPLTLDEVTEALTVDCEKENINDKRKLRNSSAILTICPSLIELSE